MSTIRRLAREPLVHFLLVGAIMFAVFALRNNNAEPSAEEIVITPAQVERLAALWQKTRQRPPTTAELDGLIADFIKEEIYYREALKLGLNENDTVIRRRLRQKIEFLSASAAEAIAPTDEQLQAFLDANPQRFTLEPKIAFEQVYVSPQEHGTETVAEARRLLQQLNAADAGADISQLGDPTLLPARLALTPASRIAREFGQEFAAGLNDLPTGPWLGPLKSAYGLHLVRVSQHKPAELRPLASIRKRVAHAWRARRRKEIDKAYYERLKAQYQVRVEMPAKQQKTSALRQ